MGQEKERKKKLYAEDDISKLAVIKSNDTIARKYMMCVAAASVAECVTYPLDLTKTRLQIQGDDQDCSGDCQGRGTPAAVAWDVTSTVQACYLYWFPYVCL